MQRVAVFCGSSPGLKPAFAEAAADLGRTLAGRGLGLVFGGGKVGLMGAVADAVLAAGGEAIGVIPGFLSDKELAHGGLTELRTTATMHERKLEMHRLSDGAITLPGGFGTLDEFFELLTWAQLGLHRKPLAVLDVEGHWTPLKRQVDVLVEHGFVRPEHGGMVLFGEEPGDLLDRMAAYVPTVKDKWWLKEEGRT